MEFSFESIQLNQLNWRDYLNQPNPVAAALMAKMTIAKVDRPKVKAECLRLLVTLKLNPAKTQLISKFVDIYLRLDVKEEQLFQAEIDTMDKIQKEVIMQTTTSWEEKGIERERRSIALNLLRKEMSLEMISEVTSLTLIQLQALQAESN